MQKNKIVYVLSFLFTMIATPARIISVVDAGGELGFESRWVFFGLLNPLRLQHFYPDLNLILLILLPFVFARVFTFLYILVFKHNVSSIYWSVEYFKKLLTNTVISILLTIGAIFAIGFGLNGIMNGLNTNSNNSPTSELSFPILFILLLCFFEFVLVIKSKIFSNDFQKFVFFIESTLLTLGLVIVTYYFLLS